MGFFSEWEEIINKVLETVKNNDNILKLVTDFTENPLSSTVPEWKDVIMNGIYPMPKDPDTKTEQKAYLNVYMEKGVTNKKNSGFRDDYLVIEVVCHLDVWMMSNGIRPYKMASYIDDMFNGKYIGDMSMNNVYLNFANVTKFSEFFYGYRIMYELSNNGNIECGG